MASSGKRPGRSPRRRPPRRGEDACRVALEVADDEIELGGGDSETGHRPQDTGGGTAVRPGGKRDRRPPPGGRSCGTPCRRPSRPSSPGPWPTPSNAPRTPPWPGLDWFGCSRSGPGSPTPCGTTELVREALVVVILRVPVLTVALVSEPSLVDVLRDSSDELLRGGRDIRTYRDSSAGALGADDDPRARSGAGSDASTCASRRATSSGWPTCPWSGRARRSRRGLPRPRARGRGAAGAVRRRSGWASSAGASSTTRATST